MFIHTHINADKDVYKDHLEFLIKLNILLRSNPTGFLLGSDLKELKRSPHKSLHR